MTTMYKPTITIEGEAQNNELRALVALYYDVQHYRIAGLLRRKAIQRAGSTSERIQVAVAALKSTEDKMGRLIEQSIEGHPLAEWPLSLRGVGPILAAGLIASDLDPHIDKPSAWWRYAGIGVVDGHNQRKRRGEKVGYNMFLRRTLELIVGTAIRLHQPPEKPCFYAELYHRFKAESELNRPDIQASNCKRCEGSGDYKADKCDHCHGTGKVGVAIQHHRRAIMLTQRVFLTHCQQRWREALGLPPPRLPYIHAVSAQAHQWGRHELIAAP